MSQWLLMFMYNHSFELVQTQLISWIDAMVKFLYNYVNNACSRGILNDNTVNLENIYDQMINNDIAWPKSSLIDIRCHVQQQNLAFYQVNLVSEIRKSPGGYLDITCWICAAGLSGVPIPL